MQYQDRSHWVVNVWSIETHYIGKRPNAYFQVQTFVMPIHNYRRRDFIRSLSTFSAASLAGVGSLTIPARKTSTPVDKREAIFNLLTTNDKQTYIPAGFFVHFGDGYRWGDAAVQRHLEYFKAIDMDFIKVQYEQQFPPLDQIKKPEDWTKMPF